MAYVDGPLEHCLKTNQLHTHFPTLDVRIYTDKLFSHKKSIRGYSCAQVFTDGHCFCRVYPMLTKGDMYHALMQFICEVGIPKDLISDRALEETKGEWEQVVKRYHFSQHTTESKSPWQNRAEAEILELKKLVQKTLKCSSAPVDFWCYALEWGARVRSLMAHELFVLKA